MPVRSIIDIQLQDQAFQKFANLFDAYSEKLRKQPELWKRINAEHEKLARGFATLGDKTEAHLSALADLKNATEDQEKALEHSGAIWSSIESASGRTAKNVASTTLSLLKWSAIFSGIAGLAGYLTVGGIEDLGAAVFNRRKSAMGLGVSVGQQQAFDISFARLLGSPSGFLTGINAAVSDLSQQGPLYALGVNPNAPTGQVAVATLQRLYGLAHATPTNQLGMLESMYSLGNLGIGVEDLRRLQSMSAPEFSHLMADYRTQQNALNLSPKMLLAWTDFVTTMDIAKGKIENVFIKGLEPLAGPLAHLTTGFEHLLEVVMRKNGPIANAIDSIASWMEKFSGKIATPAFADDVENWLRNIGVFASSLGDLATFIRAFVRHPLSTIWNGIPITDTQGGVAGGTTGGVSRAAANAWHNNPGDLQWARGFAKFGGWNNGGWAAFPSVDQGLNAMAYQLHLDALKGDSTVKGIISAYDPRDPNLPSYIKSVTAQLKGFGISTTTPLNLSDWRVLAHLMQAMLRVEQGHEGTYGNAISNAAKSVASHTGIVVRVQDKTSLGITAQLNGIGATP